MTSALVAASLLMGGGVPASAAKAESELLCAPHATAHIRHAGGIVHPVRKSSVGHGCPSGYRQVQRYGKYYPGTNPPLTYHGGPVMAAGGGQVTVTPIYWAPSGYSFSAGYQSVLNRFLADAAAASGTPGNVFSSMTQYTNAAGNHINYKLVAGAPISDTTGLPPASCARDAGSVYSDGTGYSSCLTDAQITAEAARVVAARGLPSDLSHLYVVLLPKHIESCFTSANTAAGGDCTIGAAGGSYCAYHSYFGGSPTVYAAMPFPVIGAPGAYTCATEHEAPNGDLDADVEASPLSHEIAEAITDPYLNAWQDASGYENGDECAYIYGSIGGLAGTRYNQTINGRHYLLQEEFSNENYRLNSGAGCIQHEDAIAASFTSSTSITPTGTAVSFDGRSSTDANQAGGISSYSWTFGDGGTATGATVSHTFTSAATRTVTLTVRDADGWSARTSHAVVVAVNAAPDAPGGVSAAQSGSSSAVLRWSPPKNPGSAFITGYRVGRDGTDLSGAGAYATTVASTARSFTFTNLRSSVSYGLTVQAINGAGTGLPGTASVPISATSTLTAPSSATVAESASGSATISWAPPTVTAGRTITGYRVARDGVDTAGHGAYSTVVGATARSFTLTSLAAGSTYTLSVQAVTASGSGPIVKGGVRIVPYVSAPISIVTIQSAAGTGKVSWLPPVSTAGQAVVGYRVARDGVDSAGNGAYSALVPAATRSFTLTKLVAGRSYTLTVQALTAAVVSPPGAGTVAITY